MPKESFVILNNWGSSKREPKEPFFAIFSKLTDANPNPVLLARENRFEVGVVGGFFVPGKQHGGETAALAARILNGENPDAIKVKTAGILPIFDYEALRKFSIPVDKLPPGSLLAGLPPPFTTQYRTELAVAGSLSGALLVFMLLNYISSSRRARRLSAIFANLPVRVAAVDRKGKRNRHPREPGHRGTDRLQGGGADRAQPRRTLPAPQLHRRQAGAVPAQPGAARRTCGGDGQPHRPHPEGRFPAAHRRQRRPDPGCGRNRHRRRADLPRRHAGV